VNFPQLAAVWFSVTYLNTFGAATTSGESLLLSFCCRLPDAVYVFFGASHLAHENHLSNFYYVCLLLATP